MRSSLRSSTGLSLIEVLVATSLLVTMVAGVGQLLVAAVAHVLMARTTDAAAAAVHAQLARLRAMPYGYDAADAPIDAPELTPSPPDSLAVDRAGFVEQLDESGAAVAANGEGAVLVRRWSIRPLVTGSADALAIEVCVFAATSSRPTRAEVCAATIRARQP